MKKNLILNICIFTVLFLLLDVVRAGVLPNFYFKQLSQQNGLVQNYVRSIILDHNGFYWIGTRSGLSRFDGYEFRNYKNEVDEDNTLSADLIYYVAEDRQNNLWVSTSGGLDLYRTETDDFERITWFNSRFNSQAYMVTDSAIYFAGAGNLYKRLYETGEITLMPMETKETVRSYFTFMADWDSEHWILATRWNGMWLYNLRTGELKRTPFCSEKEIMTAAVDEKGRLWVSPYGKGLVGFSHKGEKIVELNISNSELSNNIILDIEERDEQLWLATDGGGISVYDAERKKFQNIRYVVGDVNSFPFSSVFCLYKDESDNMWAGTVRGGLIGIKEVHMRSYRDVFPGYEYGLSDRSVQSLYEDENGFVWIGTDGGGLLRLDPRNNVFKHYPQTFNMKVGSISGYGKDELLIYFYSKGLYLFNYATGTIRPFLTKEQEGKVTRSAISINIDRFAAGKIHLFSDRICTYNDADGSLVELTMPKHVRYGGAMTHFYVDSLQTYALGQTFIVKVIHQNDRVEQVLVLPDDGEIIHAACRDEKGNIWIGTNKGLLQYDERQKKLKRIETNKFKEVTSLVASSSGLWIGAQNMLFRYIEKDNLFLIYGESDGAPSNEYINKATLVSSTGDVYLGGISGLLRIDGSYYSSNASRSTSPLVVKVSDVVLDGASLRNITSDGVRKISIPWDHTLLTIKLMVRENDIFRRKMFRFYIRNLERPLVETYDHTLTLHSLPAGKYEILASCSTREGEWSEPKFLISLEVVPPWWKRWWFILLVVVVAATIVYLGFTYSLRKKQNQMLLDLKEKEKKISEDKVRFLINISHELRTPLTLIYAPLKQLLSSDNSDGEKLNQQLRRIFKQARQMRNLINMVLDMRRMEVGYEELHLEPHDLNPWLRAVVDDFVEEYQTKGMKLRFEADNAIGKVTFDKEKCEIVMSNLLMNAFKYSEGNTEVVVISEKKDNYVRISVKDQGIGLSEKDFSNLFTRFYQGEHKISGSGIGLSYSKTLLEQHRGQIGAYNNEDKGATFWFELPLELADGSVAMKSGNYLNHAEPETTETDLKLPDSISFSMENYSILVIDDESELRTFMAEAFKGVFKNVYMASNGEEGLDMVRKYQPDIVVSDIMMPKMDGYEFCHRLKSDIEISHIPVVLLTVRSSQESRAISYKLGADSYLPKPFDVDLLLTIVRNLLRNRDQVKAYYRSVSGVIKTPEEQTFSNADEKFLQKLNKLIVDNLDNADLDVKYLTVEIGMSRASLYNKVKILTGLGVNDYVNRVKIEQAMQMLATTDLTVTEVSERTGFSSPRYFSTLFKQFTSETPTAYKSRMKKTNAVSDENNE